MCGIKALSPGQGRGTYLRLHLTHIFHRESTKGTFNLGRCGDRRRSAQAGGPSYLVFCKRKSGDHRWPFRKHKNWAQRWKQSCLGTPPPQPL